MVDKKVVETRYAHDSWGITICCVASFAEAWIEIGNPHCSSRCCYVVSSQRYNYNSLQNNKCIDEKFYKHFMMAVLFDCFAFVY